MILPLRDDSISGGVHRTGSNSSTAFFTNEGFKPCRRNPLDRGTQDGIADLIGSNSLKINFT
jgi:hypothetical protein